jgi:hypothetical protein
MVNIPFQEIKRYKKPGAAIAVPGNRRYQCPLLMKAGSQSSVREAQVSPQKGIRMHGQSQDTCLNCHFPNVLPYAGILHGFFTVHALHLLIAVFQWIL